MAQIPSIAFFAVMLAVAAVACNPATSPDHPGRDVSVDGDEGPGEMAEDKQRMDDLERRREARQGSRHPLPERLPPESPAQVTGEVPGSLLAAIDTDLAARLGIAAGEARVVIAEARQWNDGSLGCPQPGVMYTQAIVPGYRVVLEHAGRRYDYRASERGYFTLCGEPALPRPPGTAR